MIASFADESAEDTFLLTLRSLCACLSNFTTSGWNKV